MIQKPGLLEKMLASVESHSMISGGERILTAVSGGPDSVALLHALFSVRGRLNVSIAVAHLNHSFRGAESDADADFVRRLAGDMGLECAVDKVDVPKLRSILRLSEEEAARMARYEFLEQTAARLKADRIAVGHTADDQAETVLLNLLRGAGLDGLSGMPPVRGKIIRPLIDVRRSEVLEYIDGNGLEFRTDATNDASDYSRNRVRNELIPLLNRDYNSDVVSALVRLSVLAREDSACLREAAAAALDSSLISRDEGGLLLAPDAIAGFPLSVRRRLIREAVRTAAGTIKDVGLLHVDEILGLLDKGSDFDYELPGGAHISRSRDAVRVLASRPEGASLEFCREIAVPGETRVPEIGASVRTVVSEAPADPMRPADSMEAVFDISRVAGRVFVRNWRAGDRIRPLGMRGSKKVQDVFVDNKVPREAKARVPLITDEEKVLWIAGMTVSDEARVEPGSRETLTVAIAYD